MDIFIILFNLFLIDAVRDFQFSYFGWSILLGVALHLPAVLIGYYRNSLSDGGSISDIKIIKLFLEIFLGLGMILGFISFVWLLIPVQAYEKITGQNLSFTGLYFLMLLLFSLLSGAYGGSMDENGFKLDRFWKRALMIIIPAVFIVYSESLILLSSDILGKDFSTTIAAVFWMTAAFLPVRFFLFISPPVSILEFVSMSTAYGTFIVKLF